MIKAVSWAFSLFHKGLLHSASMLLSRSHRAEWLQEWKSELWHIKHECSEADSLTWQAERQLTSFCLGAFQDALALRKDLPPEPEKIASAAPASIHGSAWYCLLWLALILVISYAVALRVPGVDAARHSERYQVRSRLVLIEAQRNSRAEFQPTIPIELYRQWKKLRQPFFDEFAYYRVHKDAIAAAGQGVKVRSIVHASTNLFSLLDLPAKELEEASNTKSGETHLILSYQTWQRDFGGDPRVINTSVHVGQTQARIVGIAPNGTWRLPGNADAWMLEPDSAIASGTPGYLVAHLNQQGEDQMWAGAAQITAHNSFGDEEIYWAFDFEERIQNPWSVYLLVVVLTFIALPAASSMTPLEYSFTTHKPSWTKTFVRRTFFCTKVLLILAIAYFLSLDLSYWPSAECNAGATVVQFFIALSICLLGLRWAIQDQSQRCPVCLRRATHPAHVGIVSRTFLAWSGTELMCTSGHGLLHVPGVQTSWFSSPRWLYLDTSWKSLFAR